jgi:hypothetical protein
VPPTQLRSCRAPASMIAASSTHCTASRGRADRACLLSPLCQLSLSLATMGLVTEQKQAISAQRGSADRFGAEV